METVPPSAFSAAAGVGGGGGGGGPAPFLLKTYDMVDDSSTDEIVSWSSNENSFVVWNPPEFARLLLPTYFKHNNFSSFIRQLNTYGFRKIDPERWEFANEDFVRDQIHLLKNICRRKPIYSHSHSQGSFVDPERAAVEEEIDRLAQDKAALEASVAESKQQQSAEKLQFQDLTQRLDSMDQRMEKLLICFEKAVQNPNFVEYLTHKIDFMDSSAYNKKRRLPQVDYSKSTVEIVENHSCSRPVGNVIHQDFSNKLRLELSSAVSDIYLVSNSKQSSNEDEASPQRKVSEVNPKDAPLRTSSLLFAAETFELSDTGTSGSFKIDPSSPREVTVNETPGLHLLPQNLSSDEEVDGQISCHLNLTLASSPLLVNRSSYPARMPEIHQEIGRSPESKFNGNGKESDMMVTSKDWNAGYEDTILSSSNESPNSTQGPTAAAQVNDVFWQQFLTERPDSSVNEEARTFIGLAM